MDKSIEDRKLDYNILCIFTWMITIGGFFGIMLYASIYLKELNKWLMSGLILWIGVGFFVRFFILKYPYPEKAGGVEENLITNVQENNLEANKKGAFYEIIDDKFVIFGFSVFLAFVPVVIETIPETFKSILFIITALMSLVVFSQFFKKTMYKDVEARDFSKTNTQLLVVGIVTLAIVIGVTQGGLCPKSLEYFIFFYGVIIFIPSFLGFYKRTKRKLVADKKASSKINK